MEILIKNGWVINAHSSQKTDLRILDETIAELGEHLSPIHTDAHVVEANGNYIFPGGIDPHVHLHLATPAGYTADDFYSGSKAALLGGTTTLIDFVTPHKNQSLVDALQFRLADAKTCLTDYSFHISPVDWHEGIVDEMAVCKNKYGLSSFKTYMAYKQVIGLDDTILLKVMQTVASIGGMVTIHAEMGDDIEVLQNQFAKSGKTSSEYHALSRPDYMETEAVERAIELATEANCPLYIVHLSARSSLEAVIKARKKGANILVETCPQYLLLDDNKYKGSFKETAAFVISPPLRTPADNKALWQGLANGHIQTVGTDHCPFTLEQKSRGKNDFRLIPNGAGGVEHRLSLLFSEGVLKHRISLNHFVSLTSTNAAKIFGLFPTKGALTVGADADVVIWDPKKEQTISKATHKQNCDLNIYEGMTTIGAPEWVIKSGQIVVDDYSLIEPITPGKFIKRKKPDLFG